MSFEDPEKKREYNKRYYQENKKEIQEQKKRYYQENREVILEKGRQYLQKHPEKNKQYHWKNREAILERKKRYRREHPEKNKQYYQENKKVIQEKIKQYYRENPKKAREIKKCQKQWYQKNRKALLEQYKRYHQTPAGKATMLRANHRRLATLAKCPVNDLTTAQVRIIVEKAKRCGICGRRFTNKLTKSIDHIQPVSKGGYNTLTNIQITCKRCNLSKQDKDYMLYTNGQLLMFVGGKTKTKVKEKII